MTAPSGVDHLVRILCIDESGDVLLVRDRSHDDDSGDAKKLWALPGADIAVKESGRDKAWRVLAALGARTKPEQLSGPIWHTRMPRERRSEEPVRDVTTYVWRGAHFTPPGRKKGTGKHGEARWWTPKELRKTKDAFDDDVRGHLARLEDELPKPGDTVFVAGTKWDGTPHRRYNARVLGTDEHGTWLYVAKGTAITKPKGGTTPNPSDFVRLAPPRQASWHDGTWMLAGWWRDDDVECYVDVSTPPTLRRQGNRWFLEYVDLDLDLVLPADGGPPRIDDEDEFLERSVTMAWPKWVVKQAKREANALLAEAKSGRLPTGDAWREWLKRAKKD